MEIQDLENLIKHCPLRVHANDGRDFFVEKPEFITVGDYTASILFNDDGVMRHAIVSLINISSVMPDASVNGK